MRKNIFLLSIFLGLAFFLASCTDEAFYGDSLGEDNLSVCTRDAKICPDGTAVGRSGPNCEFEACPDSGDPSETCPEIYSPVCGLKEVECIQAPCDSVPVTYVNRCELEHAGAIFMKNGACEDQNETTSCTAVYEPVCGQPPMPECLEGLACIQVMPDPQTYSNACTMNAARATLIHEGECGDQNETTVCYGPTCDEKMQSLPCQEGVDCIPENETLCVGIYGPECGENKTNCTLYYGPNCSEQIEISLLCKEGTDCLSENETTYYCTAVYEPVCGQPPMSECPEGLACIQVMPDPQTYSNACTMNAARATLIHEGECERKEERDCTAVYEPVCGQPPMPECSEELACAQVMPDPQTYSNACTMNAARATLIHEGEC